MATTVQQSFVQLKSNLEITGLQSETVSTRQSGVRDVIQAGMQVNDTFLTGSYARHTMICPLKEADIDIFCVLENKYFHWYNGQNGGPPALLDFVKRTLLKTYTTTPSISRNDLWLGIPTVVISALVAFTKTAEQYPFVAAAAVIFSIFVPVLSGITTFLNPNEKEAAHLAAAHAYDRLNNAARMFWSIDCWAADATDEGLTSQIRSLVAEKDDLNKASPQIPKSAYEKAKKGIEDGEASFKVDSASS
ncbi:SLATT domain-containing protein [Mesorhizobium sp. M0816]|uniref:SLATT domain-containing protein n=1 Tax=Mesorhizobium sp. M0816 TaxID=2957006 RepID=UPI003335DE81